MSFESMLHVLHGNKVIFIVIVIAIVIFKCQSLILAMYVTVYITNVTCWSGIYVSHMPLWCACKQQGPNNKKNTNVFKMVWNV